MPRILPTLLICLAVAGLAITGLAITGLAPAEAAGFRSTVIPAGEAGPALKVAIWTPCAAPARDLPVGPYLLKGRRDCPVAGNGLPLVVISHGHGGSKLGHHDLAETLADAGFVVAALDHPGDSFGDMGHAGEFAEFVERPVDIERLIDYLLKNWRDAARLDPARIGFFGFSRGGYTGLVLAGGKPDFLWADVPCDDPKLPVCAAIQSRNVPQGPWPRDTRIKAYVLADPLNEFPTTDSLAEIQAPIQLWASQSGGDGVLPQTEPALANNLPQKPDFHLVDGTAHFVFLAPCSPELTATAPEICVDGGGFDRAAFHREMNAKALAFFRSKLAAKN